MKKILFICKYLSTNKNGFETRLATLIKFFKKNNYIVSAITSSNSLNKFNFKNKYNLKKIDNVNYYFIKEKSYDFYSFSRIRSWLAFEYYIYKFNYKQIGFKPDVIYISSLSLLTILNGVLLKYKFKAKLVFEMRDFWPYFLISTEKFSKYNPIIIFLGVIEKFGIYHSDLIISLIPKIKAYLIYRGFKNKKCHASTFPVNKKYFITDKRKNFKTDNSKFNVCYAGNFGFDNHIEDLLIFISKLQNKNFFFHLIGEGSQKKYLKKKYGILKNVKFYDSIEYSKLHTVLKKMKCLIVSFGFNSNFPLFGYELNKINNYIMAEKPILVLGSKKNLLNNRGKFVFVTKKTHNSFINQLNYIKNHYKFFLKIAKINKIKLLKRNNPEIIYEKTRQYIEKL